MLQGRRIFFFIFQTPYKDLCKHLFYSLVALDPFILIRPPNPENLGTHIFILSAGDDPRKYQDPQILFRSSIPVVVIDQPPKFNLTLLPVKRATSHK